MSIVHNPGRQYELVVEEELTLAELASECIVAKIPANATVTGIQVYVDTAFNAATTNTLSVGDSGSASRFLSAGSVAAAGPVAVTTQIGRKYTAADYIRATFAQSGTAATAGVVRVITKYIIGGRANEVQVN
jgi:hypothetical protein